MDWFWTIVVILVILWALGLFATGFNELIHILLVIAVIIIVYRLLTGRHVLSGDKK